MNAIDIARQVFEIESRAVADLAGRLDESFEQAVELLAGCSGRVVLTGMGKSGLICQKIAATLSSTGCPAYFMHPVEAVHGDLGMIVKGDLLLTISNSGETQEIVRLLELVRRLDARIVSFSGNPESTIARFSDVHLDVSVDREACNWDMVPTASSTASLAMGDALAIALYERRGFSVTDFARNHPGGRLARKLLQVEMLMHSDSEVPVIGEDAKMPAVVEEINSKGLGMVCVVDSERRLVGLLTDGDLRRLMLSSERPMQSVVSDTMTRNPTTIAPDALASEALNLMEKRKVTALPVTGEDNLLKGVIQIHDLWRTELF